MKKGLRGQERELQEQAFRSCKCCEKGAVRLKESCKAERESCESEPLGAASAVKKGLQGQERAARPRERAARASL